VERHKSEVCANSRLILSFFVRGGFRDLGNKIQRDIQAAPIIAPIDFDGIIEV
jgi:hypothetical protein